MKNIIIDVSNVKFEYTSPMLLHCKPIRDDSYFANVLIEIFKHDGDIIQKQFCQYWLKLVAKCPEINAIIQNTTANKLPQT